MGASITLLPDEATPSAEIPDIGRSLVTSAESEAATSSTITISVFLPLEHPSAGVVDSTFTNESQMFSSSLSLLASTSFPRTSFATSSSSHGEKKSEEDCVKQHDLDVTCAISHKLSTNETNLCTSVEILTLSTKRFCEPFSFVLLEQLEIQDTNFDAKAKTTYCNAHGIGHDLK
uniref:Uncharacterized protein n=1 Tax=Glossina palpalis gambiensis TaxID=67801 RepID=A0A1B0B309_9MUSC